MRGVWLLAVSAAGCVQPLDRCEPVAPGARRECPLPGWLDRAFTITAPDGWDGATPLPVIVVFHGGGGNRESAERVTCPNGDLDDPRCLTAEATARGYAVVRPDGTGTRPIRNVRTWNAGGGAGDWQCTSGAACKSGVDDLRYFDELLAEVGRIAPIDDARVYVTGLSNGGAMSHRLGCQRADRIAALASVGGGNQHAAAGGSCPGVVAVLEIHGTEDPCWRYETTTAACAQLDGKRKVGVEETMAGWAARNGCAGTPAEQPLPDVDPDDGTTITRVVWPGCAAGVELLRVDGGGHTWPGGHAYADADTVGVVSHDLDGNAAILDFFDAHARP